MFGTPIKTKKGKVHLRALIVEGKVFVAHNDFFEYLGIPGEARKKTAIDTPGIIKVAFDSTPKKIIRLDQCVLFASEFSEKNQSIEKSRVENFKKAQAMIGSGSDVMEILETRAPEDIPPPPSRNQKAPEDPIKSVEMELGEEFAAYSPPYSSSSASSSESEEYSSTSGDDDKKRNHHRRRRSHHSEKSKSKGKGKGKHGTYMGTNSELLKAEQSMVRIAHEFRSIRQFLESLKSGSSRQKRKIEH
jgi:hypothetical protein